MTGPGTESEHLCYRQGTEAAWSGCICSICFDRLDSQYRVYIRLIILPKEAKGGVNEESPKESSAHGVTTPLARLSFPRRFISWFCLLSKIVTDAGNVWFSGHFRVPTHPKARLHCFAFTCLFTHSNWRMPLYIIFNPPTSNASVSHYVPFDFIACDARMSSTELPKH